MRKTIVIDREARPEVPDHLRSVISLIPEGYRAAAPVLVQRFEPVQETSCPERQVLTGEERFMALVSGLRGFGLGLERVELNGPKMKFKAITLTPAKLATIPKGAQVAYHQAMKLGECRPDDWFVLEEVPPPVVMRPTYRLDPWLAFRVGDKYYGVFHWD